MWKDAAGLDSRLLLNGAQELTNLTDLQSRLKQSFSSKDRAMEEVERLNYGIDSLEAIDQLCSQGSFGCMCVVRRGRASNLACLHQLRWHLA